MITKYFHVYYWKRLVRSVLAYFRYLLLFQEAAQPLLKPDEKFYLWIRLDEIGDYILWRNFLPLLHQVWPEKKMILCGNIAWKQLWEALDAQLAADCVWVNKTTWQQNPEYRKEIIRKIRQYNPELTINSTYSRSFYLDDYIVYHTNSPKRIGVNGDLSSNFSWQNAISRTWYTEFLSPPDNIRFDFFRNQWLIDKIAHIKLPINRPEIIWDSVAEVIGRPPSKTYFVLFPAGRQSYKRWSAVNFAMVAQQIAQQFGLTIVIAGGPGEEIYSKAVLNHLTVPAIDLTGQTSLPQLLTLLRDATLLISNDTSSVHIATALNTPVVAVLNGTHYGRFCPYPDEINACLEAIYPPELTQDKLTETQRWEKYCYRSAFSIHTISPKVVLNTCQKILDKNRLKY